ncbi:MAG: FkbM family methyltransferase [Pseudomonadota bacterium]
MAQEVPRNTYLASLVLLQKHGISVDSVIDVGAAEGILCLTRQHYGLFPNTKQVFLDCMEENEVLYRRFVERIDADYAVAAISDHDGEIDIHVDPNAYNTHVDGAQGEQEGYVTRRVPCRMLDSLREERNWQGPLYVHLDLQGNELKAMQGATETLKVTNVVVAELQLFSADTTFAAFTSYMESQGFTLFDVTDPGHYMTSPILYQVYATYIPRRLDFRGSLEWAEGDTLARALDSLKARREKNIGLINAALDDMPVRI